MVLTPLGLTFYMWNLTTENIQETVHAKFETLASESEKALLHRVDSYHQSLIGGRGFFENSKTVTHDEWKSYVDALDVLANFPGINGIGWIADVADKDLKEFVQTIRRDGMENFQPHPAGNHPANFVITYIEPVDINLKAVGLNIAFEENRREAATLSKDTGEAAITKRILLVQDAEKTTGFLLLLPMYKDNMPLATVEQKRAAFNGWIYAPFIGKNFMKNLTQGQGDTFRLQVYDEGKIDPKNIIYDSGGDVNDKPEYTVKKTITVMQQTWSLVWTSTSKFEQLEQSNEPLLVLTVGLFFTALISAFMIIIFFKQSDKEIVKSEPSLWLPVLIFAISAATVFWLKQQILNQEQEFIRASTQKETQLIKQTIVQQMNSKMMALERMAQRWGKLSHKNKDLWHADARNIIAHEAGLRTIEWADSTYHIKWIEPLKGNEQALGLNILFTEERKKMLEKAKNEDRPTITEPLDLVQGYRGFLSYFPVYKNDKFDGFIVGIFDLNQLLKEALPQQQHSDFLLTIYSEKNKLLYDSHPKQNWRKPLTLKLTEHIQNYGQKWTLNIFPHPNFVSGHQTFLSDFTMVAGLALSIMLAVITSFAQRTRQHSRVVREKENLLSLFVKHTPAAVAMFDTQMRYMAASDRWYKDYGLEGHNIIGVEHYSIFPEIAENHPHWLELHQRCLNGEVIVAEEEVFLREDGAEDWLRYELRPWYKQKGELGGLIMFTEVITERKQMDSMKSDFISTVNHELRTPLTSIQGSLGLLKELCAKDLSEQGRKLLNLSYDNCERLTFLVNDILDMEKIMAGKMEYYIETLSLNKLVQEIIEQNGGYADKYQVTFNVKNKFKKAKVDVDANRFNQALTNLLSNAAKFSPSGGVVDVVIQKESATHVRISVQDHGVGIPKQFRDKVFERFAQADSSATRAKGGTGLGLSITKTIVEAFNGSISFHTEVDVGTTFYIILPLSQVN